MKFIDSNTKQYPDTQQSSTSPVCLAKGLEWEWVLFDVIFWQKSMPVQGNECISSKTSHFSFEEINLSSSHLHQRLRCHGRKTITWLLVTEEQSYKPQIKGKTVGRKNEKVPEDLVCLRSHWYLHLPTASALGVTGPPRKVGEPCNFLMALVFSGKLSRTWLWAQAVVHNPLNCLSINILPGTVSAHAR